MKKCKKCILQVMGMIALVIGQWSCTNEEVNEYNNELVSYEQNEAPLIVYENFFKGQREAVLRDFSESFVKSMAESVGFRELIREEALKKVNNDTEILISQLIELEVEKVTVASKLNKYLQGTTVEEILRIVPTLTVLVPTLPKNSFSAEKWEVESQLPMVAIRTDLSNDTPVLNWSEGSIENGIIPSDIIPGYPILVVKINERIVSNLTSDFNEYEGRAFHVSKLTGITYRFIDSVFDGTSLFFKAKAVPSNMDNKLVDAYNFTKNNDDWQRDYIYYDIHSLNPNGPFNYKYKEYLGFISPKEVNGSAQASYNAMADQTDPRYNYEKRDGVWNDWTDGSYELQFYFLVNAALTNDGEAFFKNISVMPSDLFDLEYDHRVERHNVFWKKNIFTLRSIKSKKYWADVEVFTWNLEHYGTSIRIEVVEKDLDQDEDVSIARISKVATNFGADVNFPINEIVKIGLKFGVSIDKSTNYTYKIKTTYGSDQLGMSVIDFGEPVVTDKSNSGDFFIDTYGLNRYSTGIIDFNLMPKRVQ